MDPITAIAASALRAQMDSLDLLANNTANASTGGYKADREFHSLYVAPEAQDNDPVSFMPVIEQGWTDWSQGLLRPTGNQLDLAISGKGFFSVDGPSGQIYTRNGSFRLGKGGKIVTSDGYAVRGASGAGLTVEPSRAIEISNDGTVQQDGNAIGQLEIVDFSSTAGLAKQGNNYFRVSDPAMRPTASSGASVEQGKLEDSNTGTAEGAVSVIKVMRQFEMMQKAISLANDMNKQAIEEVAKV
jgi:flagellar basal-body rod protein FlgG